MSNEQDIVWFPFKLENDRLQAGARSVAGRFEPMK